MLVRETDRQLAEGGMWVVPVAGCHLRAGQEGRTQNLATGRGVGTAHAQGVFWKARGTMRTRPRHMVVGRGVDVSATVG